MKFSNLQMILPEDGRGAAVVKYFEATKNLDFCKKYPLFWLQYAIACLAFDDLFRAKKYFETAYSYSDLRHWDTYQIDNHFARFLLKEAVAINDLKMSMNNFKKAEMIINRQISDNNRLHYPFMVATLYLEYLNKYMGIMSPIEKGTVKRAAEHVRGEIENLPATRQSDRDIKNCMMTMEEVIRRLP
jgi:hypothetical protein